MDNDDNRPDPDELLKRINAQAREEEEQGESKGMLKIFFGACAGVGKTYAMLSAGQQALEQGRDVLIGVVETHGRKDTEKLLAGTPLLPRKEIAYKGAVLKEFDLDAALAKKPEIILIDELAHTNAHGSRHPKRWQDIEELINAGIDVYTTVNVQHIESLNDVVARITGVWVKETVPDAFFDTAGAISLVDIPTEELLQRLKEGKVYIAPGAKQRAAQNFFKKSNLIALRELALRRTAERVDAQMDDYKSTNQAGPWSGADKVLVCIGPGELSSKLVRVAKRTSDGLKAPWTAVYVENEKHYRMNAESQAAVERTLKLAERMGGHSVILKGDHADRAIIDYARQHNYTKIIIGTVPRSRWREAVFGTLADKIIRISEDIDVYVVTGEDEEKTSSLSQSWHKPMVIKSTLAALLIISLATMVAYPLRGSIDDNGISSLYFIGVVWLALRVGRFAAFLGVLLSGAAFNFLMQVPYLSFKVIHMNQLTSLVVMMLTGLIIGGLTSRMRLQAIRANKKEQHTAALYSLSNELSATRGKKNLVDIAARHIGQILNADISVWLPTRSGELECYMAERPQVDEESIDHLKEESAASWSYANRKPAGLGTDTLPNANGYYMPMISANKAIGVVGLTPEKTETLTGEQLGLLSNIVGIIATAVERANAAELVERAVVESESEKLRNIILSSVSHDLRTPLAAISGTASTLLLEQNMSPEFRDESLRLIHEEAARLARMVTNLLDATSLQSGTVHLNKELYFIEELVGSAIMRMESRLEGRHVDISIRPGLPLVKMDGLLIEQVLINILENLADHTPDGTKAEIIAEMHKPDLHVIIKNDGPSIPEGDEERIFDRFYHNESATAKDGAMGLAICRGIITAHGGKIWAQNNPEGGSTFTFTLPLRQGE